MQQTKSVSIHYKAPAEVIDMLREVAEYEGRPVNNLLHQLVKQAHARMKREQQNDAA